jgi:hypothetical protein
MKFQTVHLSRIENLITCLNCVVTRELKEDERHTHTTKIHKRHFLRKKRHFFGDKRTQNKTAVRSPTKTQISCRQEKRSMEYKDPSPNEHYSDRTLKDPNTCEHHSVYAGTPSGSSKSPCRLLLGLSRPTIDDIK